MTLSDLQRMRSSLYFEGAQSHTQLSRFAVLLAVGATISAAGVASHTVATVVGGIIVAPLMTPVLGIVLAIITGDRRNFTRAIAAVLVGMAAVFALGWLVGLTLAVDATATTNEQVDSRVNPGLMNLLGALATGAAGAFVLARDDISDTLPRIAFGISLVPPLAVAGLAAEAGAASQARGAFLLFSMNLGAIVAGGVLVLALYGARSAALLGGGGAQVLARGRGFGAFVAVSLVASVVVPLALAAPRFYTDVVTTRQVAGVAKEWAERRDWTVRSVTVLDGRIVVRVSGSEPAPDPAALRRALDRRGLQDVDVRVELVPEDRVDLPGD